MGGARTVFVLPRVSCYLFRHKLQGWRKEPKCFLQSQSRQLSSIPHCQGKSKEPTVRFDSPEEATSGKSTGEVFRGWLVFKLLTYDFLVDHCLRLYDISKRVLGRWLTEKILRATIVGQFAGGVDEKDTLATVQKHAKRNISSIWNYSTEQDIDEVPESAAAIREQEHQYGRVNERYLKSIEMSACHNCDRPTRFAAVKMTAIINTRLLIQRHCGRLNACRTPGARMVCSAFHSHKAVVSQKKLSDLLQASEEVFHSLASPAEDILERRVTTDVVLKEFPDIVLPTGTGSLDLVNWTSLFTLPHNVSHFQLLSKMSAHDPLSLSLSGLEQEQLDSFIDKIGSIGERASALGVRVLVDAEQSYFQPAIRHFTVHYLMRRYNSQQPLIYDTLQTYLTSSFESLRTDLATAKHFGMKYGAKVLFASIEVTCHVDQLLQWLQRWGLAHVKKTARVLSSVHNISAPAEQMVRGAYMEQERKAAAALGHTCPVHPDKPSTDRSYHRVVDHLLNEVTSGNTEVMVATHNQETLQFALERIHKLGLSPSDGKVMFGQLLGMGDHLTYPLAQAGYCANKVAPYGPLDDIMPYLSRRAQENRGIITNAQAERFLYARELKRRLWG